MGIYVLSLPSICIRGSFAWVLFEGSCRGGLVVEDPCGSFHISNAILWVGLGRRDEVLHTPWWNLELSSVGQFYYCLGLSCPFIWIWFPIFSFSFSRRITRFCSLLVLHAFLDSGSCPVLLFLKRTLIVRRRSLYQSLYIGRLSFILALSAISQIKPSANSKWFLTCVT